MLRGIINEFLCGLECGIAQRTPTGGGILAEPDARGAPAYRLAGANTDHQREGKRAGGEEDEKPQHYRCAVAEQAKATICVH